MANLGGGELIILPGLLLLFFGAKKLPDMARSVGRSARVFRGEMKGLTEPARDASAPPADTRSRERVRDTLADLTERAGGAGTG